MKKYAVLKVSEAQYQEVDKKIHFEREKRELGISCLTNEKQYYVEKLSRNRSGEWLT